MIVIDSQITVPGDQVVDVKRLNPKIITYLYPGLLIINTDLVIELPDYKGNSNVIILVTSLGVPLRTSDYTFNSNTGDLLIYNYDLMSGDNLYIIPVY